MEKTIETTKRLRMNLSISAKGVAQWDITAEYETPQESAENLSEAIDKVRQIIEEKGLTEATTIT
jgi:hypothetical protein